MGTANLNAILGSQNCIFEKADIGYQIGFKGKQRKYNSFFKTNEQQLSSPLTCFYCMRKGHSVRNCKIKKFNVPNGLVTLVDPSLTGYQCLKFNLFCRSVWHLVNYCGTWTVDAPNI